MHFADIDKILDRRMVLTMKQDNEIFLASREIEARIPINILYRMVIPEIESYETNLQIYPVNNHRW